MPRRKISIDNFTEGSLDGLIEIVTKFHKDIRRYGAVILSTSMSRSDDRPAVHINYEVFHRVFRGSEAALSVTGQYARLTRECGGVDFVACEVIERAKIPELSDGMTPPPRQSSSK